MISAVVEDPQMRKLKPTVITNWLEEKGFLEKLITPDGKSKRIPTQNGIRIGLFLQTRQGQYGAYQSVYYDPFAQQFVLDNLMAMMAER